MGPADLLSCQSSMNARDQNCPAGTVGVAQRDRPFAFVATAIWSLRREWATR